MARAIVHVISRRPADLPADWITNTLAFQAPGTPGSVDYEQLAEEVKEAFSLSVPRPAGYTTVEAKVYEETDPEPRPIRGQAIREDAGGGGAPGPREVAICLSFYAVRNLPKQRGRVYIGPLTVTNMAERPSDALIAQIATLVPRLDAINVSNFKWAVWSRVDGIFQNVTNWWIDDEWDTQRRRGLKSTKRSIGTVSP